MLKAEFEEKQGPSEYHSVEFGPDHLQQLRVEEVLTQAEGAPVAGAHAAQPGVAEETDGRETHQDVFIEASAETRWKIKRSSEVPAGGRPRLNREQQAARV